MKRRAISYQQSASALFNFYQSPEQRKKNRRRNYKIKEAVYIRQPL